MIIIPSQPVKYRGTVTGLRISAVDGTAFIDNAGATIPTYADGNHQIEIYDSSNRMLKGVLKAAGTSETTTEVSSTTAWTGASGATPPTGWAVFNPLFAGLYDIVDDGAPYDVSLKLSHDGTHNNPIMTKQDTVIAQRLYKLSFDFKKGTATKGIVYWGSTSGGNQFHIDLNIVNTSWATKTYYGTSPGTASYITLQAYTFTSGNYSLFDSQLLEAVDTPSSSGATIVSAKGGATQSFATVQTGFAYNAAAYSVVVRKAR